MLTRNIWAIGRNYADHAKELGNSIPKEPLVFLKAGSTLVEASKKIQLPSFSQDIHHEVEVALKFGHNLQIQEITLALDLTARDKQAELKSKGSPWTLAKSFKNSCPIGPWIKIKNLSEIENYEFWLQVNGEKRQHGFCKNMIFPPEKLVSYVLDHFPVEPNDILLTGTPQGVSQIHSGDHLSAEIKGILKVEWNIA